MGNRDHRSTHATSTTCVVLLLLVLGQFAYATGIHHALLHWSMREEIAEFWDNFDNGVTSSDCKTDLLQVVQHSRKEEWALKIIDAWAKPQTGILTGNSMHLGNFDECLSVNWYGNNSNIRGQYCSAFIDPHDPQLVDIFITSLHGTPTNPSGKKSGLVTILDKFRLSWGICVPHSCSIQNLEEAWGFTKNYFNLSWDVELKEEFCDYEGKEELSDFAYFTILLLFLCVSVVIAGTIYHAIASNNNKKYRESEQSFLMTFSAYANCKRILNGECSDPLACLNAVRVLSLCWIIVRHYFMLIFYFPHLNAMDMNEWKGEYGNMFILSGNMAVDSFFTASGLSVAYIFLKKEEHEKFSLFKYYVEKFIRVMPTLILVVLIYASLLKYLGDGPFWPIIYNLFQRDCENNWWSTVLFIANYAHPTGHCLTQGWYLSVDIQLFLLSPLLLLPLRRWPRPTILATILLTLASMAQCFIESWTMELGSTHFDENAHFHANIVATHIRAPCWLIGFVLGYVLHKYKDTRIDLNPRTVIILWSAAIFTFLLIILGHESVASNEYNVFRSSAFNTLVRPAWSIALCWVIFACVTGYGGIVNKILTAPIFNIIIKINFNMFLLHVLPQIFFIGQTRMSTYFSNTHNLYLVLADLAGALLLAFFWTLIIDPWIVTAERVMFNTKNIRENKTYTISLIRTEKLNDLDYITTEHGLMNEEKKSEKEGGS